MRTYLTFTFLLTFLFAAFVLRAQSCTPVTINCISDITITADPGACGALVNYTLTLSGDCQLVTFEQIDGSGLTSGQEFPIGTTMQSWRTEDIDGHTDTCTFQIEILEFPNPIHAQACNANVNLSPDADCELLVTADMILEGGPYGCYANYIVTLTTLAGTSVPNPLTEAYVGETLIAMVADTMGNSCWGYIHFEDYLITPLACGTTVVDCRDDVLPSTDPLDSIPFPIPPGYNIMPATGLGPFIVEDYDNCGDITLAFTDQVTEIDCTLGGPYTRTILRSWIAMDESGNTTSCMDTIHLRIPSLSSTNTFPNRNGTDAPSILCSDDWDTNNDGIPQPEEIGDILNMNCDVWGEYTDIIHYLNCGVLIDRSWEIVNMCTGEFISFIQQIRLEDDEAPVISCEPILYGSTLLTECHANYHVHHPFIEDDCSFVTYTVTSSSGVVVNLGTPENPAFTINELPIGSHLLTFTAVDGCGNTASCTSTLHIEDQVPPTARCEANLTLYLGSGQDGVSVNDLDNYSYDACGIAEMKLRRVLTGPCADSNQDDLTWHEFETFCCEESGQTVLIELGVWDIYGNFSSCITHVTINGNTAPSMICPPDITISCSYPLDTSDLTTFGRVVTDPEQVMDVVIDDPTWVEYCKGQTYTGPMVWGTDGLALSDCPIEITESVTYQLVCGRSEEENGEYLPAIIRTFEVRSGQTVINSCEQKIYILDCNPGTTQINWPVDVAFDACTMYSTDPDVTGRPIVAPGVCDEVKTTYTDTDLPVIGDTCRHIERTWTATSECHEDQDSLLGTWNQQIYVISSDTLRLENCIDTIRPDSAAACMVHPDDGCIGLIQMNTPDVISCDTSISLIWEIDYDYNHSIGFVVDSSGEDSPPDYIPFGQHVIRWFATDMCGDQVYCESFIEFPDCEPPIAICEDIGVQVIQDSSGIVIYATDIVGMSTDNCDDITAQFIECDSAQNFRRPLFGIVDSNIIRLDEHTGEILERIKIKNINGADLSTLQFVPGDDLFYTLVNGHWSLPGSVQLAAIDLKGDLNIVGELQYQGMAFNTAEGMTYIPENDRLIVSGSFDDGDSHSDRLAEVDRATGELLTVFIQIGSHNVDADHMTYYNGEVWMHDYNGGNFSRFYSIDLPDSGSLVSAQVRFDLDQPTLLTDFAIDDEWVYSRDENALLRISLETGTFETIGEMHDENDFHGNFVRGFAFAGLDSLACVLTDSLIVHCDDLIGVHDTIEYAIVVSDNSGNADTCYGSFIVADSNELCKETQCELIYAINTAGQYYSINTATGDFNLIVDANISTNTNAVAVNDAVGIGYFGTEQSIYWVDLTTGDYGLVGNITVPGSLSAAAASCWNGYLFVGPETANLVEDIFRIPLSADGKSFTGLPENITNGSVPIGNFGDFVVLEGGLNEERMVMSIFNNANANIIWEYLTSTNTFTQLSVVPSTSSSQITIDNVGKIWYFNNATNMLGIIDINTGVVTDENPVAVTISDMGRAWCPPEMISSTNTLTSESPIEHLHILPNPFVSETTLEYDLSNAGENVLLNIYSLQGALVYTTELSASHGLNQHELKVDLTPGTYVCQIRTRDKVLSGKMVKLK